ncbi:MAG: DUF4214 domain-containing protein, partial [Pseudomonadota bacterium]
SRIQCGLIDVAAAAASVGLPLTAVKADYDQVLANAKAFQPALALEVTQTAKQADEATAATATAHVAASYTSLPPRSVQALQLTQMYQMLLARTPTQIELNEGLGLFANGRTLADQANALIAATPALSLPTLSNDAYANTILTNSSGAPVTATIRIWSDQLSPVGTLDRGGLLVKLLTDVTRTNLGSGTLTFNTKVGTLLTAARNAALADATTPVVASYVTANAFVARDAVVKTDAAAKAAQPPAGAYATELAQLYLLLLGRAPEATALASAIAQRAGGTPLLTIAQSIVASNEEQGRMPSTLSNADFVKALFQMGLGRAADATEQSTWTAKLAGTTPISRAQLAINLIADLYAYSGSDGVKLSAQTVFLGRVSEALGRPAIEARGTDHAIATLQDMLSKPIITQYSSVPSLAKNGGIIASQTPLSTRTQLTVDRWGNVLTVSDMRDPNWKITYTYNYNNQLISQTLNSLGGTPAKASTAYDALGRQVSSTDFNGNTNALRYDGNGNVAKETHADGGTVSYTYDLFGDRMTVLTKRGVDPNTLQSLPDLQTDYTYDHLGHLTDSQSEATVVSYVAVDPGQRYMQAQALAAARISQHYVYDALGRNIASTGGGAGDTSTGYDLDGNVIRMTDAAGNSTLSSYDAFHHKTATLDANGNRLHWTVDAHGQVTAEDNFGSTGAGAVTFAANYRYDGAGRKVHQGSTAGQYIDYFYTDGQLTKIVDTVTGVTTSYSYDLAGNRLTEQQSFRDGAPDQPIGRQNNVLTYDMQNRLTGIKDNDYTIAYTYDANGNRLTVHTEYDKSIGSQGHFEFIGDPEHPELPDKRTWIPGSSTIEHKSYDTYNSYDSMNRQLVVNGEWVPDGSLAGGHAVHGATGHAIAYDLAGNRVSDTYMATALGSAAGTPQIEVKETYGYDAVGRLSEIRRDDTPGDNQSGVLIDTRRYDQYGRLSESGLITNDDNVATMLTTSGLSTQRHVYAYDSLGHLIAQRDNDYVRDAVFTSYHNEQGLLQNTWLGNDANKGPSYDKVGNLIHYVISPAGSGPSANPEYQVTFSFTDGYREATNKELRSNVVNVSGYDVNGNKTSLTEQGQGTPKTQLWYDADGHVQSKIDTTAHFSLIVNGQVLGEEDKVATNVLGSIYSGATSAALTAPPASYSVQGSGETLQSIAQAVWGDSKLWYLIGEANSLNSDARLKPGDILRIPTRVNTLHNDYATFRPYNAADAVGSSAPAMPMPSQGGGCGGIGSIIVMVVVVVVAYYTGQYYLANYGEPAVAAGATAEAGAGAAAGAGAGVGAGAGAYSTSSLIAAGAVGGAAGSIAGQAVGNAIGTQHGFSWSQVALSAIGGGVSGGMTALTADGGALSSIGDSSWQSAAARAALSNAVSQGIGVVTGLQPSFSWRGVVASAAGGAVGNEVGGALAQNNVFSALSENAARVAVASVSGFSAGLTTSVLRGGKIAVAQIATDAFGNALGESLARTNWSGNG